MLLKYLQVYNFLVATNWAEIVKKPCTVHSDYPLKKHGLCFITPWSAWFDGQVLYSSLFCGQKRKRKIPMQLEALRERRPPWPRQIITLILPTVKKLSLGCERLPIPLKKKGGGGGFWIITCTTIWACYHYYGVFLLIYSSYNTQITTKI